MYLPLYPSLLCSRTLVSIKRSSSTLFQVSTSWQLLLDWRRSCIRFSATWDFSRTNGSRLWAAFKNSIWWNGYFCWCMFLINFGCRILFQDNMNRKIRLFDDRRTIRIRRRGASGALHIIKKVIYHNTRVLTVIWATGRERGSTKSCKLHNLQLFCEKALYI